MQSRFEDVWNTKELSHNGEHAFINEHKNISSTAPSKMNFVVAQLGARNHYSVPTTFEKAGILERLYTDLLVSDFGFRRAAQTPGLRRLRAIRQVAGRTAGGTPPSKTYTFPLLGLKYTARLRLLNRLRSSLATNLWAGRQFCERVAKSGFASADSVYTFNSAALEILEAAKRQRLFTVLEQTIAPMQMEREILEVERSAYSEWETHAVASSEVQAEFEGRERDEAYLADVIICPSEFVRSSIRKIGWPVEKCRIVPYGVDPTCPNGHNRATERKADGKLQVLFVGTVSLRKGVHYAAGAAALLGSIAQFSMLGTVKLSEFGVNELQKSVTLLGVLPRSEVQQQMAMADVLILPSLCEGSATVCYEALAAGLPVITTENAGSVVRHGIDGYIVPIRDIAAIVDCVAKLASDRSLLAWMSGNAKERAAEYTTAAFGRRLLSALDVRTTV